MVTAVAAKPCHILESQTALLGIVDGVSRIDRENRIIKGVKVVGLVSGNSPEVLGVDSNQDHYSYTLECLRDAIPMYEGVSVFIDHLESEYDKKTGKRLPSQKGRKLADKFGKLRNVRVTESGMFADLHYFEAHPMAAMVVEAAERMPDAFALSHYAFSTPQVFANGEVKIVKINHVESVDLIGERPGTTHGLFESLSKGSQESMADEKPGETATTTEMDETAAAAAPQPQTLREKLLAVLNNPEFDDAALVKAVGAVLGLTTEADDATDSEEAAATESDDDPLDMATSKEADEAMSDDEQAAQESAKKKHSGTPTMESRLAVLERKLAFADRKDKAIKRLGAEGIAVTESRVAALARAATKSEVVGLISDWKQLQSQDGVTAPRSAPPKPSMQSVATESLKGQSQAEDLDSLARSVLNG